MQIGNRSGTGKPVIAFMPVPTRVVDIDLRAPLPAVAPLRASEGLLGLLRYGPALVGRLSADGPHATAVIADLAAHIPRGISPERFADGCHAAGVPARAPAGLALSEVLDVFRADAAAPRPERSRCLVSVVVCTRYRREHLIRCLESLLHLTHTEVELILVDNNDAGEGVFDLAGRFPCRYVKALRPGLSRSRNRALAEAKGEIVAFTHDDAEVDPGWVEGLVATFTDPEVHAATGPVLPRELITRGQEWFENLGWTHPCWYRARSFGPADGCVAPGLLPGAGANLAVRRERLQALGGFDELLGAGTPTGAGEDVDLLARVLEAGGRVAYTPAAIVRHRHRIDMEGARAAAFHRAAGFTAALTRLAHRQPQLTGAVARQIARCAAGLAGGPPEEDLGLPRTALARPVRALAALYGPVSYLRSWWQASSSGEEP